MRPAARRLTKRCCSVVCDDATVSLNVILRNDLAKLGYHTNKPRMHPGCQLSPLPALTNPCLSVRLLIVKDEPRLLRSLTGALQDEGFAVDTAADGIDGAAKAEATNYDAIILDLMLPGLDGWQVLGACDVPSELLCSC